MLSALGATPVVACVQDCVLTSYTDTDFACTVAHKGSEIWLNRLATLFYQG